MDTDRGHRPLTEYQEYPVEEMRSRAAEMCANLRRRRTVRHFSDHPVPLEIVQDCLAAAGTAPSGANMQPWHFVVVSDSEVKRQIRIAAEEGGAGVLQSTRPPGVAGRPGSAGDRRAQAFPGDGALPHRDLRPELRSDVGR